MTGELCLPGTNAGRNRIYSDKPLAVYTMSMNRARLENAFFSAQEVRTRACFLIRSEHRKTRFIRLIGPSTRPGRIVRARLKTLVTSAWTDPSAPRRIPLTGSQVAPPGKQSRTRLSPARALALRGAAHKRSPNQRDRRPAEKVRQAQSPRFAAALERVSDMQGESLSRTEERRRELDKGIEVIQATLKAHGCGSATPRAEEMARLYARLAGEGREWLRLAESGVRPAALIDLVAQCSRRETAASADGMEQSLPKRKHAFSRWVSSSASFWEERQRPDLLADRRTRSRPTMAPLSTDVGEAGAGQRIRSSTRCGRPIPEQGGPLTREFTFSVPRGEKPTDADRPCAPAEFILAQPRTN